MSIATKTGDEGETSLMYGRRVQKTDGRVDAYGSVDELNSALGLARASAIDPFLGEQILAVQKELVIVMGELATAGEDLERYQKDGFQLTTELSGVASRRCRFNSDLDLGKRTVATHLHAIFRDLRE